MSFFGWPAAALTPLVPAVHALRLFGRLESETDRSWMIFLAGVVVLLPIAVGLADRAAGRRVVVRRGHLGRLRRLLLARVVRRLGAWVVVRARGERAHGGDAALESGAHDRRYGVRPPRRRSSQLQATRNRVRAAEAPEEEGR